MAKYGVGFGKDPALQAAVDTGKTIQNINRADALAEDGFANNDTQKILEAKAIRPNDWSYDQQLSVLTLVDGEQQSSNEFANDSENKVLAYVDARVENLDLPAKGPEAAQACATNFLNMYRHREAALIAQIDKDPNGQKENAISIDQLFRELDLTRLRISELVAKPASGQCAKYGSP